MKIFKVLGKRGRITIPFEIRQRKGFSYNDIISFEEQDDRTVIIRREKICYGCKVAEKKETDTVTLLDFLNGLSLEEQYAALVHLSVKWAEKSGGKLNAR